MENISPSAAHTAAHTDTTVVFIHIVSRIKHLFIFSINLLIKIPHEKAFVHRYSCKRQNILIREYEAYNLTSIYASSPFNGNNEKILTNAKSNPKVAFLHLISACDDLFAGTEKERNAPNTRKRYKREDYS